MLRKDSKNDDYKIENEIFNYPDNYKEMTSSDYYSQNNMNKMNQLASNRWECNNCAEQTRETQKIAGIIFLTLIITIILQYLASKLFKALFKSNDNRKKIKKPTRDLKKIEYPEKKSNAKVALSIRKLQDDKELTEEDFNYLDGELLENVKMTGTVNQNNTAQKTKPIIKRKGRTIVSNSAKSSEAKSIQKTDNTESQRKEKQTSTNTIELFELRNREDTYIYINKKLFAALDDNQQQELTTLCRNGKVLFNSSKHKNGFIINPAKGTVKAKIWRNDWRLFGNISNENGKDICEINQIKFKHKQNKIKEYPSELANFKRG